MPSRSERDGRPKIRAHVVVSIVVVVIPVVVVVQAGDVAGARHRLGQTPPADPLRRRRARRAGQGRRGRLPARRQVGRRGAHGLPGVRRPRRPTRIADGCRRVHVDAHAASPGVRPPEVRGETQIRVHRRRRRVRRPRRHMRGRGCRTKGTSRVAVRRRGCGSVGVCAIRGQRRDRRHGDRGHRAEVLGARVCRAVHR